MRKIQYTVKTKIRCRKCGYNQIPRIKMIKFKNSEEFICSCYCTKCDQYIVNIPRKDINIVER